MGEARGQYGKFADLNDLVWVSPETRACPEPMLHSAPCTDIKNWQLILLVMLDQLTC